MRTAYPGMVLFSVLFCLLAICPDVRAADDIRYLYEWRDDQGVVNVADSLDKVPSKYRSQAKQILQPGPGKEIQGLDGQRNGERSRNRDSGPSLEQDEIRKAEWQQRLLDAKRRLAAAEDRYNKLEQRRNELLSRTGSSGAALPTQEMLDEMNELEQELGQARIDVDNARNVVDVVIPEKARRAGIPPGWLREVQ